MAATDRPNVVFVLADQLQAFALGCMGDPEVATPHLDALAARGALFESAYACAPVCTPFRGCLMSGRFACQTGVTGNNAALPEGERHLAESLRAGGCFTSYVGKWHLGDKGNVAVRPELRPGFDAFLGYQCYNDYWRDVVFYDEEGRARRCESHRTEATTDLAVERLRAAAGHAPFALIVSYQNPHYPEQPAPAFDAMYRDRAVTLRPNADAAVDPYTPTFSPYWREDQENDPANQRYGGDLREYVRCYRAMVSQLDAAVGRLLAEIDRLGIAEETFFVFTSDHGDMQASHGLLNKGTHHEESARIPLIARGPGIPAGRRIRSPVSSIDLHPTLLDLAGAPPAPAAEGRSLAPLARGERDARGGPVVIEEVGRPYLAVRKADHKLVLHRPSGEPAALYDLARDPYEMTDRLEEDAYREARHRLAQEARAWERDVMERANPNRPA